MPSYEYDRRYVERGLEQLERYLLAEAAYWPVDFQPPTGEPPYPLLTLEGLMLSLHRMLATQGNLFEETQTAKLSLGMDGIRNRWRVAWEKKATQAYQARLHLWRNYLEELNDIPEAHADRYGYEVRLRVFLALLEEDCVRNETLRETLIGLDAYLRTVFIPGRFIWAEELQKGFPADGYWYLYGALPRSAADVSSRMRH